MFYKLSKLSGRLVGSTQLKAMLPQGLRPFAEPQQIIYDPAFKVAGIPTQEMKLQGREVEYGPVPEALRKKMIKFQKEDGVPVHLKGGRSDYVLLGTTLFLIAVGLVESVRYIHESAFPKKA